MLTHAARFTVTPSVHAVRMLNLDSAHDRAHGGIMTGNTIKLVGAIDRADPDPAMPTNPWRSHIGMVTVYWSLDGDARRSMAALIRDSSSARPGPRPWLGSVLCLVWIGTETPYGYRGGDAPPADVVQAVYDWLWDRGPARGEISATLAVMPRSESSPSYRAVTA